MSNSLSRTAASVALALVVALAAPMTAQALSYSGPAGSVVTLGSHFAAAKKSSSKKKGSSPKKKSPPSGGARQTVLSPIQSGGLPTTSATTDTIKTILKVVFGIIGAFALLSMVASGLKYITSGGDPGKTSEAKKGVIFALVGLMIAISAEAIVAFVINRGAP